MKQEIVKVETICDLVRGSSPRPQGDPRYYGGIVPRLMIEDITRDGRYVIPKVDTLTEAGALLSRPMRKGDLVLTVSGRTGVPAILAIDACIHDGFVGFRNLNSNVEVNYLYWYLSSLTNSTNSKAVGAIFKNLTTDQIKNLLIPLPPLPTQRAIADRLDRADALRQKDRQLLQAYDDLAQSVFVEMFGDPVRNEKGWEVTELGLHVTIIGGGTPRREVKEYFTGDICWATSKDIKKDYLVDTEEHITEEAVKNSSTKMTPPGTILLVVKSKILMHSLPISISTVPVCFGQDIKGLITKKSLDTTFLSVQLKVRKHLLLNQARGVNTEGLTLVHLNSFPLLLPPLPLQTRFAAILANIERQKELVRQQQAESGALFGRLLQEAFGN